MEILEIGIGIVYFLIFIAFKIMRDRQTFTAISIFYLKIIPHIKRDWNSDILKIQMCDKS